MTMNSSTNSFLFFLFLLPSIFAIASAASGFKHDASSEKTTHLHFYFHELYSGPNATAAGVVPPPMNNSGFGGVGVVDDMLKEGPEPSSKLIGRGQGLVTVASLEKDSALLTALNFVFTGGEYKGSTLSIFGRAVLGTVMERPIVGGSGKFRMARGYTLSKRVNSPPGLLVLEYDAYIIHY